jgi:alpha-D-xyloside xylohydrolase
MTIDPLAPDWPALTPVRELGAHERVPGGLRCRTDAGPLTAQAYAPAILRLTLGEPGGPDYGILAAAAEPPAVAIAEQPDGLALSVGDLRLVVQAAPLRFRLERAGQVLLASSSDAHFRRPQRLPPFARSAAGWFVALGLASGEAVYGLGEKWGPLNRRGQLLRSRVEDALGVNAETSYKNTPFAWSPRGWGLLVHTTGDVTHGVGHPGWSQRSYGLAVDDPALDLFLIAGDSPAELLERYTWLTGRPAAPPRWSLGAWFSKAYYRDADELLGTARRLRERRIPADVITLDGRAWQDTPTRFAFRFDPARYPDPKAVIDQLHALDLKLCVWEYPLVAEDGPLFAELAAKGFLLTDPASGAPWRHHWDPAPFGAVLTPLPVSGLIDFTHPGAFADWRERHAALFELGVDVIKSDFGEQVPDGCRAANGDSGRRLHNVYPLLYNACVAEATARARGQGFVFARAGWAGSQRFPGHWGGDPQSDWEGLAASIRGALSWGLSGGACYATDIGGFYGPQPDAELFVRWTQAAVFASHLRFHGLGPREPWIFGDEIEAILRDWLLLRYRLIPYLEACLTEAARSGLPPLRAMPLACPDQPEAWGFDTQYLFGRDLLVAPILAPGGGARVYLPEGRWHRFPTGPSYEGGRSLVLRLPLAEFPVFARGGAAIPLGPAVQHTGELAGRAAVESVLEFGA